MIRTIYRVALVAAAVLGSGQVAQASEHIINIPALALLPTGTATGDRNFGGDGILANAEGTFYAAVNFPKFGRSVCSFTLYARDNDALDVQANLYLKGIGSASTFAPATLMASVSTAGFSTTLKGFTTTAVTNRVISGDRFYFVEVVFPTGINVDVLGLKIVHLPTC